MPFSQAFSFSDPELEESEESSLESEEESDSKLESFLFSRNEIQILNGLNTTYKVFYFKIYYETISKPRSKKN